MIQIYKFDFSYDDGNWTLLDAIIQNGVLDITVQNGYGRRSPDADWNVNTFNDFIIEVDTKVDVLGAYNYWKVWIKLVGDAVPLLFYYRAFTTDEIRIQYPSGTTKASQVEAIDDLNWHTPKIRREGTIFYLSVDGGDEISWDYGTARALEHITLEYDDRLGEYDNFKCSWNIPFAIGVGNPMIL